MARPLTKTKPDGTLYVRPPCVETQIDETVQLPLTDLEARLLVTNRDDPAYLSSECLVHLVRKGRRADDQPLMSAVLPVLLSRCEANLLFTVPDGGVPDAASLRQEILDDLAELFAIDETSHSKNQLDFFECKFNRSFMTLRIDAVRRDERRRERIDEIELPSSEPTTEADDFEAAFARLSESFWVLPTQRWDALRNPFLKAIKALPSDERKAVILVHVLGYKVESQNPEEETAATRCNCTGRTIRNRLTRASAKLSRFKEEL